MNAPTVIFEPDDHVPVDILPGLGDERFRLRADFAYAIVGFIQRTIKAGFTWDGASIPWLVLWFISDTDSRIIRAGLVHDDLYRNGIGSRRMADTLFLDICLMDGRLYAFSLDKAKWRRQATQHWWAFRVWCAWGVLRFAGRPAWQGPL